MAQFGSVTHWIGALKSGDQEAAQQLWQRYWKRLVGLAAKKISGAQRLSGFKPLQRQLTQQLLDFYLYFLEQHRDEPAYRADIADVHYQLGVLATSLETLDAANLHYENSLKVLLQLVKDEPRHKPHRRKLSECYNGLGTLRQASGDLMAAEKNYLQASQLAEKLASEPPASDRDHQLQMTVLNNLATLYMIRGNATEAISCFQKILVPPEEGKPAVSRTTLAAHLNLSVLYRTTGKLSEASSCLAQASQILDQLRKDRFNPEFLHDQQLAWYISQTNLEISLGHWEAARKTSATGVQVAEVLVASHPGEVKYEVSLAQLHLNATAIWTSIGNFQQASDSAQKAILILHRLRDKDPGNLEYQTDLARGLHNLAESERRLQHRETALRTIQLAIQEKQRIVDQSPEDKYRHLLLSSRIVYADLMRDAKQYIPALEQYRDIYGTARELVEKNGDELAYQFTLATVSHSLGQMQKRKQRVGCRKETLPRSVETPKTTFREKFPAGQAHPRHLDYSIQLGKSAPGPSATSTCNSSLPGILCDAPEGTRSSASTSRSPKATGQLPLGNR